MSMSKLGKVIATFVIGAFAILLVGMVAGSMTRAASPIEGNFVHTLKGIGAQNLEATAVAPADVYGERWAGAAVICPGTTPEDIEENFRVRAADLGIEGDVPENINYLMVMDQEGTAYAEKLDRSEVDLCQKELPGAFDARMMMPMMKTPAGVWTLNV